MKRLLFLLFLGVLGAILFRSYAYEGIYVATDSMAPTLRAGTPVFVNKFIYKFQAPRRGDVVMFDLPSEPQKGFVKRVIAIEGDLVEIREKAVYLNGQQVPERYTQYTRPDEILVGDNLPPMRVPPDHVLVLGDNRDVSNDSRDWKNQAGQITPFLPIQNIRGRVKLRS